MTGGPDTENALLAHAERQTAALETIRKVLVGLAWALAAVVFVAAIVGYIAAVS